MFFKVSMRTNPETGRYSGYYRLVESYRNLSGRVCHRTLLNVGCLDALTTEQRTLIPKILSAKAENNGEALFQIVDSSDPIVNHYVNEFYDRLVAEKRIDVASPKQVQKQTDIGKDWQVVDFNSA
jgi:hypothetical protein